jgi:hypothetical protein
MNGGKKGMAKSEWVIHFHETVSRQKMKISKKYGETLFYDSFSWQSHLLTYRSCLVQPSHASEQTYLTSHTTIGLQI